MDSVFIYALNCPITGRTRYVGKAKNLQSRFRVHLSDSRSSHRKNWIQSLLKQGFLPVLEILDEVPESEWQQWEVAYIQFFREAGFDLVNATAGGEGAHNPSEETRSKLSKVASNRSAEWRKNMSAAQTGKKASAETRLKMSDARKGKSNGREGTKQSEEARAKISKAASNPSEENRAKKSATMKAVWAKRKGEIL